MTRIDYNRRRRGGAWQWTIIGLLIGFGCAVVALLAGLMLGLVQFSTDGSAIASLPSQTPFVITTTPDPNAVASVSETQTPFVIIVTSTPDTSLISTLEEGSVQFPVASPTLMPEPTSAPTTASDQPAPTITPGGVGDLSAPTLTGGAVPSLISIASQLVPVESGQFQMGTIPAEIAEAVRQCIDQGGACETSYGDDSRPDHIVSLDAFLIERTEVTYSQYIAFLNYLKTQGRDHTNGCGTTTPQRCIDTARENNLSYISVDPASYDITLDFVAETPAVFVTWYGADAYCRALGRRLPTEAEWERAARGISNSLYPWGNDFIAVNANTTGSETPAGAPLGVTEFLSGASTFGALNMAGNVAEWTGDWYGATYYSQAGNNQNPTGPISGINRVVRGGSFADRPFFARSVQRTDRAPDQRLPFIGFRCASNEASTSLDGAALTSPNATTTTGSGASSPLTAPPFLVTGTVDAALLGAITTPVGEGASPTMPPAAP